MRVTQKEQVAARPEVREALVGADERFALHGDGHLVVPGDGASAEVRRMSGAGDVELTTDEILG